MIIKNTLCQRSLIITHRALLYCPSWYYVEVFSSTSEPSLYPVETATIISCSYVNFLSCYSQLIAPPVPTDCCSSPWNVYRCNLSFTHRTRYVSPLMSSCFRFNQSRSKYSNEDLARMEDTKWKFSWRVAFFRTFFRHLLWQLSIRRS